jgi:hypothetical protein
MQGTLGFYNNHIENDGSSCPMIYSGNVTPTFHNNNTQGSWSSIPTGTGNISVDPLFVDPDNYDFHIGRGSPLINAGAFS